MSHARRVVASVILPARTFLPAFRSTGLIHMKFVTVSRSSRGVIDRRWDRSAALGRGPALPAPSGCLLSRFCLVLGLSRDPFGSVADRQARHLAVTGSCDIG